MPAQMTGSPRLYLFIIQPHGGQECWKWVVLKEDQGLPGDAARLSHTNMLILSHTNIPCHSQPGFDMSFWTQSDLCLWKSWSNPSSPTGNYGMAEYRSKKKSILTSPSLPGLWLAIASSGCTICHGTAHTRKTVEVGRHARLVLLCLQIQNCNILQKPASCKVYPKLQSPFLCMFIQKSQPSYFLKHSQNTSFCLKIWCSVLVYFPQSQPLTKLTLCSKGIWDCSSHAICTGLWLGKYMILGKYILVRNKLWN